MVWKPDKAPGRKREQKQRLARQQKRKDFAKNMERADALVRDYHNGTNITAPYTGDLEPKFVDWVLSKYRNDKSGEEMSNQFQNMSNQWREILVTAKTCAKATAARTYPKRMAEHKLVVAKFRADRTQSRIEASERVGAVMQAKMEQRALR